MTFFDSASSSWPRFSSLSSADTLKINNMRQHDKKTTWARFYNKPIMTSKEKISRLSWIIEILKRMEVWSPLLHYHDIGKKKTFYNVTIRQHEWGFTSLTWLLKKNFKGCYELLKFWRRWRSSHHFYIAMMLLENNIWSKQRLHEIKLKTYIMPQSGCNITGSSWIWI